MLDETKEISVRLNAYSLLNSFCTTELADYLGSQPNGWRDILSECDEYKLAHELVRRLGLQNATAVLHLAHQEILHNTKLQHKHTET